MTRRAIPMLLAAVALLGVLAPRAEAQEAGLVGDIPADGGIALVIWGGGSVGDLAAAAADEGCGIESAWATVDGQLVGYAYGVPDFVNAGFTGSLGAELQTMALLIVCADGGPSPSVTPTPSPTAQPQSFRIDYIDVGQGDATLITVDGERLLIDGGRSGARIVERLDTLGITDLDAILSTHPDADHIAGLNRVLELYDVERVYMNGGSSDTQTFTTYLALVAAEGATVTTVSRGTAIQLGDLTLDVMHPAGITGDSNEDSAVLQLSCGTVSVLLMGDATTASETSMLAAGILDDVDVLKVGHHGSDTSSGAAFLAAVSPEHAVISAGLDNQYGHPHAEVLDRLDGLGAAVYLTDTTAADDTLTMTSDCQNVVFDALPSIGAGSPPGPAPSP